jgi:AraC-like DNA-binding protein/mannose-6-phosphate isomerase-like protein (cupin superfamily)
MIKNVWGFIAIMQKQVFSVKFEPLPIASTDTLYFDIEPVLLPYAEDFPLLHYHDKYEIGICYDGEGMFLSDGNFSYFSKGDVMFVPPYTHHYARSIRKSKPLSCRFVYLSIQRVEALMDFLNREQNAENDVFAIVQSNIPAVIHAEEYPRLNFILTDLMEACTRDEQNPAPLTELKTAMFFYEAYGEIRRELKSERSEAYKSDASIDAVAEYISLHYDKNDGISDLASLCLLSESQLRRRFARVYGTTPIAYRLKLRCKIAAELLSRTKFPVQRISDRVGFSDVSDLYKAFKKIYGMSPSEYRAENVLRKD